MTIDEVIMCRRPDRNGRRTDADRKSRTLSKRLGALAVPLVSFLFVAPSGSVIPAAAGVTPPGVYHEPIQIQNSSHGLVSSPNWSGYADTGASFTTVVGTWVQPTASCAPGQQTASAFWVGIDGFLSTSKTVEQAGTEADCTKGNKKNPGGPSYYAWWEMFPALSTNLSVKQYPVSPGDTISAQVTGSGSTFTLTVSDQSQGWSFSPPAQTSASASSSSAEWIAEAPLICKSSCSEAKLTNFTSVSFSGAGANGSAISAFSSNQINMIKGKKLLKASASALSGGSAFSVAWHHN